jgi:hypothetical protein
MKRFSKALSADLDNVEGLSRQDRYKILRYRAGLCINCSARRGSSPYKRLCLECGKAKKLKRRKAVGSHAWKPGRSGRPPLTVKKEQE